MFRHSKIIFVALKAAVAMPMPMSLVAHLPESHLSSLLRPAKERSWNHSDSIVEEDAGNTSKIYNDVARAISDLQVQMKGLHEQHLKDVATTRFSGEQLLGEQRLTASRENSTNARIEAVVDSLDRHISILRERGIEVQRSIGQMLEDFEALNANVATAEEFADEAVNAVKVSLMSPQMRVLFDLAKARLAVSPPKADSKDASKKKQRHSLIQTEERSSASPNLNVINEYVAQMTRISENPKEQVFSSMKPARPQTLAKKAGDAMVVADSHARDARERLDQLQAEVGDLAQLHEQHLQELGGDLELRYQQGADVIASLKMDQEQLNATHDKLMTIAPRLLTSVRALSDTRTYLMRQYKAIRMFLQEVGNQTQTIDKVEFPLLDQQGALQSNMKFPRGGRGRRMSFLQSRAANYPKGSPEGTLTSGVESQADMAYNNIVGQMAELESEVLHGRVSTAAALMEEQKKREDELKEQCAENVHAARRNANGIEELKLLNKQSHTMEGEAQLLSHRIQLLADDIQAAKASLAVARGFIKETMKKAYHSHQTNRDVLDELEAREQAKLKEREHEMQLAAIGDSWATLTVPAKGAFLAEDISLLGTAHINSKGKAPLAAAKQAPQTKSQAKPEMPKAAAKPAPLKNSQAKTKAPKAAAKPAPQTNSQAKAEAPKAAAKPAPPTKSQAKANSPAKPQAPKAPKAMSKPAPQTNSQAKPETAKAAAKPAATPAAQTNSPAKPEALKAAAKAAPQTTSHAMHEMPKAEAWQPTRTNRTNASATTPKLVKVSGVRTSDVARDLELIKLPPGNSARGDVLVHEENAQKLDDDVHHSTIFTQENAQQIDDDAAFPVAVMSVDEAMDDMRSALEAIEHLRATSDRELEGKYQLALTGCKRSATRLEHERTNLARMTTAVNTLNQKLELAWRTAGEQKENLQSKARSLRAYIGKLAAESKAIDGVEAEAALSLSFLQMSSRVFHRHSTRIPGEEAEGAEDPEQSAHEPVGGGKIFSSVASRATALQRRLEEMEVEGKRQLAFHKGEYERKLADMADANQKLSLSVQQVEGDNRALNASILTMRKKASVISKDIDTLNAELKTLQGNLTKAADFAGTTMQHVAAKRGKELDILDELDTHDRENSKKADHQRRLGEIASSLRTSLLQVKSIETPQSLLRGLEDGMGQMRAEYETLEANAKARFQEHAMRMREEHTKLLSEKAAKIEERHALQEKQGRLAAAISLLEEMRDQLEERSLSLHTFSKRLSDRPAAVLASKQREPVPVQQKEKVVELLRTSDRPRSPIHAVKSLLQSEEGKTQTSGGHFLSWFTR